MAQELDTILQRAYTAHGVISASCSPLEQEGNETESSFTINKQNSNRLVRERNRRDCEAIAKPHADSENNGKYSREMSAVILQECIGDLEMLSHSPRLSSAICLALLSPCDLQWHLIHCFNEIHNQKGEFSRAYRHFLVKVLKLSLLAIFAHDNSFLSLLIILSSEGQILVISALKLVQSNHLVHDHHLTVMEALKTLLNHLNRLPCSTLDLFHMFTENMAESSKDQSYRDLIAKNLYTQFSLQGQRLDISAVLLQIFHRLCSLKLAISNEMLAFVSSGLAELKYPDETSRSFVEAIYGNIPLMIAAPDKLLKNWKPLDLDTIQKLGFRLFGLGAVDGFEKETSLLQNAAMSIFLSFTECSGFVNHYLINSLNRSMEELINNGSLLREDNGDDDLRVIQHLFSNIALIVRELQQIQADATNKNGNAELKSGLHERLYIRGHDLIQQSLVERAGRHRKRLWQVVLLIELESLLKLIGTTGRKTFSGVKPLEGSNYSSILLDCIPHPVVLDALRKQVGPEFETGD